MLHFGHRFSAWAVTAFFCCASVLPGASTNTTYAPLPTPSGLTTTTSQPSTATCEARTINYITHSLPQVCLRYPRADSTLTSTHVLVPSNATVIVTGTTAAPTKTAPGAVGNPVEAGSSTSSGASPDVEGDSALDESSFLSFEDWKKQTLERESAVDAGSDKRSQSFKDGEKRRNPEGIQDALKALEEDVVIDTDFTAFLTDRPGNSASEGLEDDQKSNIEVPQTTGDDQGAGGKSRPRSKDAGKTCKERSNFASLDAGGQVMNANAEAKSASALLKEDRDVYMLNNCQAKNKFVIVELSESILVETVAIANFEFFSSTFRHFRISVSDRYPVKLDRWVDLGTFEARNSRDIQAFLVEDPRIWARYFRLELLSHYGNEFYCPISLLRVHGRTMIQDVLSMEDATRGEEEVEDDVDEPSDKVDEVSPSDFVESTSTDEERALGGTHEAQGASESLVKSAKSISSSHVEEALETGLIFETYVLLENASMAQMTTPWTKSDFAVPAPGDGLSSHEVCLPLEDPTKFVENSHSHLRQTSFSEEACSSCNLTSHSGDLSSPSGSLLPDHAELGNRSFEQLNLSISTSVQDAPRTHLSSDSYLTTKSPLSPGGDAIETSTGSSRLSNKTSATTSSYTSQPTTQESFFKTVTKRLQLLEANSTLSLKYIEEQSKILRDAFTKVEKRQFAKTTSFLENLNDTVLEELRKFGQQYDQIWQSTVIELETQRDQSRQEIAAISSRLGMIAEELVFQKRMSIVQSILLLLCLCLVIFSHGSAAGYVDMPLFHNIATRPPATSGAHIENASNISFTQQTPSSNDGRLWSGPGHRRQRSDDSATSLRSRNWDTSPPTPFSAYSGQGDDLQHSVGDVVQPKEARSNDLGAASLELEASHDVEGHKPLNWQYSEAKPGKNLSSDRYLDFSNSALWLAQGQSMTNLDTAEHSQSDDNMATEAPPSTTYQKLAKPAMEETLDHLSALPEDEKREFIIARKPLPALPTDK